MKSITQIALENNIPRATIAKRVEMLNSSPVRKIWLSNYYDQKEVEKILNYHRYNVSDKKKILIVEYFLMFRFSTPEAIAKALGVPQNVIKKIITEYLQNDECLIIESKL